MQAIVTKWLGPTDTRGSRIKVWCDAKTMTVAWDHALDVEANHKAAIKELALSLGWRGFWTMGAAPQKGSPHAYVATCNRRTEGGTVHVIGTSARDEKRDENGGGAHV